MFRSFIINFAFFFTLFYISPAFAAPVVIVFIVKIAISIAISLILSSIFATKPKQPTLPGFTQEAQDRLRQVQSPIAARDIVYGEGRKSGILLHMEATEENKFLHMVIGFAGHECEAITTIYINDDPIYESNITVDSSGTGLVTSGKYNNLVKINKHLGTDSQGADGDLVSDIDDWTSNHRLRRITYLYIRLQFNQDIFPSSIPNISAWVKGKKVAEIRDSGEPILWTTNPALILRDYLITTPENMGMGFKTTEIDDTFFVSAANICDQEVVVTDITEGVDSVDTTDDFIELDNDPEILQFQTGDKVDVLSSGSVPTGLGTDLYIIVEQQRHITDSAFGTFEKRISFAATFDDAFLNNKINITDVGSGTITVVKKAEPRYSANGVLISSKAPIDNIDDILTSMGGIASHISGRWIVYAAAFRSPTVFYDESDLRSGGLTYQTRHGRKERFNRVKGTYISPINSGVATDYPPVLSSTYVTEDNGEKLWKEHDLPFTSRPHTAQRLAKIFLEKHRQQIGIRANFNLSAFQSQPGDVIQFFNEEAGWTDTDSGGERIGKEFEVIEWRLTNDDVDGVPLLGVDMTLGETAAANYDWNNGEETLVDPAPNTNLTNPFTVGTPTAISLTTEVFSDLIGAQNLKIRINWASPSDFFVTEDGIIEIQFKKSIDSIWEPSFTVPGEQTTATISQVEDAINYDVRLRSINHLGVRSNYNSVLNYLVGSTVSGADSITDFGFITQTATVFRDYQLITDSVDSDDHIDYGTIV